MHIGNLMSPYTLMDTVILLYGNLPTTDIIHSTTEMLAQPMATLWHNVLETYATVTSSYSFLCTYMYMYIMYESGTLGVWGELVNDRRSLTHVPVLKAGHLSVPFILCLYCSDVVYWMGMFPSFLLFFFEYLSCMCMYVHVRVGPIHMKLCLSCPTLFFSYARVYRRVYVHVDI